MIQPVRAWRAFWIAVQFLTRLPTPRLQAPTAEESGAAFVFFPLVGLLIAGALLLVSTLFEVADPLSAALVVAVWVICTGGLHLDGLADTVDAWVGGHGERERTLAILKEPTSGPMGVAALIVILLLKYGAIAGGTRWEALLLAPFLARAALIGLFLTTPYVRPGGLGAAFAGHMPRHAATAMVVVTGLIAPLWLGAAGAYLLALLVGAGYLLRRAFMARLGGTTGDTAGAAVEILEALTLVVLAVAV